MRKYLIANVVLENILGQRKVCGEMQTGFVWVTGILSSGLDCDIICQRQ